MKRASMKRSFKSKTQKPTSLRARVAAMRAQHRSDHRHMAEQTFRERRGFVNALQSDTHQFLDTFRRDHHRMATEQHRARAAFVQDIVDWVG